jgi:hypothetical protein
MLQEVLDRLGPGYVAVRPDHLAHLWREEMERQKGHTPVPRVLPALEGQPLTLEGTVRNVSNAAQDVVVRAW